MASLGKASSRDGWELQFRDQQKRKRKLWIGKTSKRSAEGIQRHVTELVRSRKANIEPAADTAKWVSTLTGRIRDRLVDYGICDAPRAIMNTDAGRFLGPFLDFYIESRTDWKERTIINYKQAKTWMVKYFGDRKPLREITSADAERWSRWLRGSLAEATCSKHTKRAKTMFKEAVKDRILPENPFADVKGGNEANPENDYYIDLEMARAVLDACPDAQWRAIFGLARFGGLRCPSEVLGLTWCDINWDKNRFLVRSPKTEHHEGKAERFTPLFPAVRQLLEELAGVVGLGVDMSLDTPVITRYRSGESNLRTQLHRYIELAGHKPWPRAFKNLRGSAITDAKEAGYQDHELDAWFGNSEGVRRKHYYQVKDENYDRALALFKVEPVCSSACGSISANPGSSTLVTDTKKPNETAVSSGIGMPLVPPQGLEPWTHGLRVRCSTN